jgi:leader peptidase (prepilin peptidase)/N-methyltransferase
VAWSLGSIGTLLALLHAIGLLFFLSAGLTILVADTLYQLIPDGAIILIILASFLRLAGSPSLFVPHIGSALMAFGLFYFLWWITREKGMGFGDVKLAGVLGLFLGYPDIVLALYCAFLTGAVVGVILIIGNHAGMKTKIAFGPFLIIGAVVSVWFGPYIYRWVGMML